MIRPDTVEGTHETTQPVGPVPPTGAEYPQPERSDAPLVVTDLIEEISIDGMCGVY